MNVGKFKIDLIDTGSFALDGGAMFGVVPKTMWTKAYSPADEKNRIPMASRPMLIRFENKVILVDAGNGTKMPEKLVEIYGIDIFKSDIELGLSQFGLKPEDITHFIYTHLHFDHAGGSTKFKDGKAIPLFTNAKHYVQKKHWEWALKPTQKDKASFFKDDWMPVYDNGMMTFIDGEDEILPGITVHPLDGHTKALQMVKVSDGSDTIIFPADLSPTSAHIKVPFVMGYDNFPLTSMEEKQKYFSQAAEEGWTICFEHDAFLQAAKIANSDKGFEIKEKIEISS